MKSFYLITLLAALLTAAPLANAQTERSEYEILVSNLHNTVTNVGVFRAPNAPLASAVWPRVIPTIIIFG